MDFRFPTLSGSGGGEGEGEGSERMEWNGIEGNGIEWHSMA